MTNDERMTKSEARNELVHDSFWGAHAPSRAVFGALAETSVPAVSTARGRVRDHEGVIASTRGACAPL
ncbi:MAG: hypothetical protein DMG96_16420 [Acidobacteria bacterium]|nr:MAG: hypothetical protein DMG98_26310 [Acidobacteriota bacterium]PYV75683.1 MAG: hypothetical protein DMG96_16420 [Acidobacteriota bacterium]